MKKLIVGTLAAFALSACASTTDVVDEKMEMTPEAVMAPEAVMVCAVKNPDGTCACETVDVNGDCVEGGGAGVIVQGGNE